MAQPGASLVISRVTILDDSSAVSRRDPSPRAPGPVGMAGRARPRADAAPPSAVRQSVRSVVVEVQPGSVQRLRDLIRGLRDDEERTTPKYDRLKRAVPALHFMSMTVFQDAHHDPIFVLEVNFDGAPGPFWAQLEAAIGPQLRAMLRCCEPPADRTAALFAAVVAEDSRRPIAPLLEARTLRPAVHHVGNRGLARERVLRQAELFLAVQDELGDGTRFRGENAVAIHQTLRARLLPRFPWLDQPQPPRITVAERVMDGLRLAAFVAVVLLALALSTLALSLATPPSFVVALSALIALLVAGWLGLLQGLRHLRGRPRTVLAVGLAGYVVLLLVTDGTWRALLAGVPATVLLLLAWLRRLEQRDPAQDAPPLDEAAMRAMACREDRVVQNHMGSLVLVKPGVLRAVLVRVGLRGLGLVLRVAATDGYLGSMRTIHFAHWALVDNGSRLMFFSNFDGSWESYLDDFIEKAHRGLTLAWGSGVGFPRARYLVLDGASQGRKFKAWARHSMAESLFWFSAYPDFTVNEIERHASVAAGLCRPLLAGEEAVTWTRQL